MPELPNTDLQTVFVQVAIAFGLGGLVGLQRESVDKELAGLRTFPLITVAGTLSAYLSAALGVWVLAAGILSLTGLVILANAYRLRRGEHHPGMTTELAILLMFLLGAYVVVGHQAVAVVIGGAVAVLLEMKERLHGFADKLGRDDVRAIMRFVLIALVILPILPDRAFGPFDVLNPYEIWLLVVLIVGISLGGYIISKFVDTRAGVVAGGLLGGIISSTATNVSYSKRTRGQPESARAAAVVLMIANVVVMIRVLAEIWFVGRRLLPAAAGPILVLLLIQAIVAFVFWRKVHDQTEQLPEQEDPADLRTAITFGFMYALVLLAVAATRSFLGTEALYLVAGISGLTDVDAITLSTAKLAQSEQIDLQLGWRLIVVATMSNMLFKLGVVGVLGVRRLFLLMSLVTAIVIGAGVAILLFWPG